MHPADPLGEVPGPPLARGDLSAREVEELRALKRLVEERTGLRCAGYKEKVLRRRIAVRMRAREATGYADYAMLLENDPEEYQRLVDAVTINVSKFFRNAEVWDALRTHVLPLLTALDVPRIDLWSAGAAAGEEAYSLAILLLEHAQAHGGDLARFRILATDIDAATLAAAHEGVYTEFALTETPPDVRERWFEGERLLRVRPEVRRMVDFETLDLLRDDYPGDQHLILCRNVIIYFERDVQQTVFLRLHDALAPGGWLLLGKVEALFGRTLRAFQAVSSRERLFRKHE